MRARWTSAVVLMLFATAGFAHDEAHDVYLSVGGSVGNFRTDARIFNPSYEKDITITARYLPAGNADNQHVAPVTITLPKRTQAVYDDVVQSLFNGGAPLGAVRLTSDDDFVASQRIYADERANRQGGTLGQYVPGLDSTKALRKGVLFQLKSGPSVIGSFRTNWGGVNPNAVVANVEFELYGKDNTLAGTNTLTIQPYGVISPQNITGFFGNPNVDLSDAWIRFESDQPVFIYGSVVDNGSSDPTFIPASEDSGVEPAPPVQKTVTITARDFTFDVVQSHPLRAGDSVRVTVIKANGTHTFAMTDPQGNVLINTGSIPTGGSGLTFDISVPSAGSYNYVCTNGGCGSGHFDMFGSLTVDP